MASKKVNITNTDNKVTVTNSNNKIEVIDTNVASNIEVTQPVTSIVQINAAGPKGGIGSQGIQGIQGPEGPQGQGSIFTNITSDLFFVTSSIQISGSLLVSGSISFDSLDGGSF